MKVIAHRGFSALYPENTLLAFQKALEAGADGIETDLRLTLDSQVILFHDDDLDRMTGRKGRPESFTLETLQKLELPEGEHIPTLEALFALVDGVATLVLEIKYIPSTYRKLCKIIAQKAADRLDWVEVSSFEDKVLEYMHRLNPSLRLHKIINEVFTLGSVADKRLYDHIHYLDIDVSLRGQVMKMGLLEKYKVIFWTADKEELTKEIAAGLYGVMLNDMRSISV
ncbi:glycerophosphodiester phosphodiesterase [Sulfurovum sp. ST-21]|uniref:GP-PDE domain-containing protein n=1 Tax=Sulfurovum indicum TaxID=2779528 RepID=A0A7M1S5X1_9BACT|nr:glycerophosphodiester phosphodiesterase [Sulfurovum indicum]QOR62817.1 hypothetical protein IMZ28_04945 [Sulfurovum indicum]